MGISSRGNNEIKHIIRKIDETPRMLFRFIFYPALYRISRGAKTMKIVIEKAREKDRDAIFALLKQANMHHVPSEEMPLITFENYFVAKDGGDIVGFCGYKILSPTQAKTELMVVNPNCRGHGVGYALQERRMEDMLQKGIRTLTTNTDLPATIAWYKKHFAYREIGTLKKLHEFSDPEIDHWTTLQTDLLQWKANRLKNEE